MSSEQCDVCGRELSEIEARWGTCDDCEGDAEEAASERAE
jgi:hypothetical protein